MNIQTISDNFKQREEINNALETIYAAIIRAEAEHASKLSKSELAQYQEAYREIYKSERRYGQTSVGYCYGTFGLDTSEDYLKITPKGIEATGIAGTQSGDMYDPIFIPAYAIEAYGTEEFTTAIERIHTERTNTIKAFIQKKAKAAKAAQKAAKTRQEANERAQYERLRAKYEGENK